jgi:nitrite reductase/ring-hydroxylating ferredoxin subunit
VADSERVIGRSADLVEGGTGIRFEVRRRGVKETEPHGDVRAFVVRWEGRLHAYVNQCRHQATELDWNEGEFFDESKQFLVCATHGALYRPSDGYCVAGPCAGSRLEAVEVREHRGDIWVEGD